MGKTRGFTLVELAIVLVIIGIILGAILKGNELINNAKAKRLQNDLRGLEALVYTFYDRYGRFPGDCDNNGTIEYKLLNSTAGPTLSTSTGTPSFCTNDNSPDAAFNDLRAASLLNPNLSNAQVAKHVFNGYFAIGYNGTAGYNAIAIYNIPAWAASAIDASIDGAANGTVGRVRRLDSNDDWSTTSPDTSVALIYFFDKY
jgi:prepilin-type N-terminal cleavage/methylation domain-containing protein